MLKVTYEVLSVFSLKKYNDSHLSARSYEYPMLSTIRGALISSVIERRGKAIAEEMFRKIKNAQIFIQYQKKFNINQQKIKRMSNNGYLAKYDEENVDTGKGNFTVGIREVVAVNNIVFYIDESIEDILEYLVNIDRIGDSESLVKLVAIEKATSMKDVLVEWNETIGYDVELHELYDWETKLDKKGKKDSGTAFENIYRYSDKIKDKHIRRMCYVKDRVDLC